mgnify:CR=1 FL=1
MCHFAILDPNKIRINKRDIIVDMDFLLGTEILEERTSPINGKIKVVKSLGFGTYIQVNNLTQSGGVIEDIWRSTLRTINKQLPTINNCLILGLGGGTAAKLVRKFWPEAKITGVDIDPIMVELGTRHLGLGNSKVKTIIGDAYQYSLKHKAKSEKFDLVLVDLYIGYKFPRRFETQNYIHLVRNILSRSGIAVFNRLYYGEKRPEAMKFGKKLEKVFSKVEYFYPEANVMFICYNKD